MAFQINATIGISPATIKAEIEAAFDAAYKGERGDDETPSEFLERKLEEHVLAIYQSRKASDAAATASRNVQSDIAANAQIKQKKMKPEPPPSERPTNTVSKE